MTRPLICICICTRERPALLARALASLAALERPEHHDLALVIVENEPEPKLGEMLAGFDPGFPVHHVHEPRLGLVMARNRALDEADRLGATWVAGFDDDEEALPDWLRAYEAAMRARPDARLMTGPYWYRYSEDYSRFLPRQPEDRAGFDRHVTTLADGAEQRGFMGGNSLMHKDIFGSDGMGMRFDPHFNFSGSEDTEFGLRAEKAGQPTLWVRGAIIRETKSGDRARFRGTASRLAGFQVNSCRIRRKLAPGPATHFINFLRLFRHVMLALTYGLKGILLFPLSSEAARGEFGLAGLRLARAWGVISYYVGAVGSPYRTIAPRA